MNEGIRKFRELLLTDEAFQQKLKAAAESYTGEQTEEALFNGVIAPLAAEYGISGTFDEFKEFVSNPGDQEMDSAELTQVAGGGKGAGGSLCLGVGIGIGQTEDDDKINSHCIAVGVGGTGACAGVGATV